jgi:hypothetical protein
MSETPVLILVALSWWAIIRAELRGGRPFCRTHTAEWHRAREERR